ncbi:hypothetical protein MTO96_014528 [Rhipicephalus appendiculatus]
MVEGRQGRKKRRQRLYGSGYGATWQAHALRRTSEALERRESDRAHDSASAACSTGVVESSARGERQNKEKRLKGANAKHAGQRTRARGEEQGRETDEATSSYK